MTRTGTASEVPNGGTRFHSWFAILGLHVLAARILLVDPSARQNRFASLTGLAALTVSLTIAWVAQIRSVSTVGAGRACLAFSVAGLVACALAGSFLLPWAALLGAVLAFQIARMTFFVPADGERQERSAVPRLLLGRYRLLAEAREQGRDATVPAVRVADDHAVDVTFFTETNPAHAACLRKRADVASRLDPRWSVPVLDVGSTDDQRPFVVTEKIGGEDLETALARSGRLSLARVVRIVDEVAAALSDALERGVIHGQIDPRKVVLIEGPAGFHTKLLDFGTAWPPSTGQPSSTDAPGSAGYRAPEQVSSALGALSPRTDVFALAAVAYRALTGREAFPARLPSEAAYEALHRVPDPVGSVVSDLPEAIDAVLLVALAKDPARRYDDARHFGTALAEAASGEKSRETGDRLVAARGEALQLAEPTVTIR